jgi:transposase
VPLLLTVPGIGWVLAFTIASEIGDITRFPSAKKLCGYTGLCPRVHQSGEKDRRGPLTKQGPKYLRWGMLESTMHALRHPAYAERYKRNKKRLGRQRGARVAQIDIARKLTDLLPALHGWLPTLRIADFEVKAWIYDRGAHPRMADLLAKRL